MPLDREHGSFSPAEIAVLARAFEDALQALGLSIRKDELQCTVVAKIIIDLAEHGETDPRCLRDEAVQQARKRFAWFGSRPPLADPGRH